MLTTLREQYSAMHSTLSMSAVTLFEAKSLSRWARNLVTSRGLPLNFFGAPRVRRAGMSRRLRGRGAAGPWGWAMAVEIVGVSSGCAIGGRRASGVLLTVAGMGTETAMGTTMVVDGSGTKRGVDSSADSVSEGIQRMNGK